MKDWMTQWGSMVVHSETEAADHHGYYAEIETIYGTKVPVPPLVCLFGASYEENTDD